MLPSKLLQLIFQPLLSNSHIRRSANLFFPFKWKSTKSSVLLMKFIKLEIYSPWHWRGGISERREKERKVPTHPLPRSYLLSHLYPDLQYPNNHTYEHLSPSAGSNSPSFLLLFSPRNYSQFFSLMKKSLSIRSFLVPKSDFLNRLWVFFFKFRVERDSIGLMSEAPFPLYRDSIRCDLGWEKSDMKIRIHSCQ